jgi:hypothetical protein
VIRATIGTTLVVALLGNAPMQCSRSPDPENRREDTAGDALWDLAEDFLAKGNDDARKQTLRFLVEKYPSNRHAPAAREELGIAK